MSDRANTSKIYLAPGQRITCKAGAAVTGSRFAKYASGGVGNKPNAVNSVAGDRAVGVAFADAASGADVLIVREGVVGVTAEAALTAGQPVKSGTGGRAAVATPGTDFIVGYVVADTASGALAPIDLNARG